jgi:osmotically-inducible protein OsmY
MSMHNILSRLAVIFFAFLLVWLPGCSALSEQESAMREPAREKSEPDSDENVDSAITARVKAAISGEPSLKDEEIGVETSRGNVRLTGPVSSILIMKKAIEVARAVKGVREVKDEMQFRWQY